jgi:hypothetical protein
VHRDNRPEAGRPVRIRGCFGRASAGKCAAESTRNGRLPFLEQVPIPTTERHGEIIAHAETLRPSL